MQVWVVKDAWGEGRILACCRECAADHAEDLGMEIVTCEGTPCECERGESCDCCDAFDDDGFDG